MVVDFSSLCLCAVKSNVFLLISETWGFLQKCMLRTKYKFALLINELLLQWNEQQYWLHSLIKATQTSTHLRCLVTFPASFPLMFIHRSLEGDGKSHVVNKIYYLYKIIHNMLLYNIKVIIRAPHHISVPGMLCSSINSKQLWVEVADNIVSLHVSGF